MTKILISTLYGPDPVMMAFTKLSPERLVLLVTDEKDKVIKESLELIKKSLGRVIKIETVKIPQYDITKISEIVVKIIDGISLDDDIYVNITSGRKTQSIAVLFGAYARRSKISRIAYYPEGDEKGNVIYLPLLSMKLTESQRTIMDSINSGKSHSYKTLAKSTGLSTAMVYRAVDELIKSGYVEKESGEKIVITEAGKLIIL